MTLATAASRCVLTVAACALLGSASDAHARGYGMYVEGEYADTSVEGNIAFNPDGVDRDFEDTMIGLGFVFDTNVAADSPFSYRFKVGYRTANRKWKTRQRVNVPRRTDQEDQLETTMTFISKPQRVQGVTFNQTITYGVLRRPDLRLWVGPTLRFNADWYGATTGLDIVDISVGGGPEIGINYHLGERVSLTSSIAYHYMYFGEHFETKGDDIRFDGSQHLLTFSIGLLFRTEFDRWLD